MKYSILFAEAPLVPRSPPAARAQCGHLCPAAGGESDLGAGHLSHFGGSGLMSSDRWKAQNVRSFKDLRWGARSGAKNLQKAWTVGERSQVTTVVSLVNSYDLQIPRFSCHGTLCSFKLRTIDMFSVFLPFSFWVGPWCELCLSFTLPSLSARSQRKCRWWGFRILKALANRVALWEPILSTARKDRCGQYQLASEARWERGTLTNDTVREKRWCLCKNSVPLHPSKL